MIRLTTADGPMFSRVSSSTSAAPQKTTVATSTAPKTPTLSTPPVTTSQKTAVPTPTAPAAQKAAVAAPTTTTSQQPKVSAPGATTQTTRGQGSIDIANQLMLMAHDKPDFKTFDQLRPGEQKVFNMAASAMNATVVGGALLPVGTEVALLAGGAYSAVNNGFPEKTGITGADYYSGTAIYVAAQDYQAQMKIDRTARTMQAMSNFAAGERQIHAESAQLQRDMVVQTGHALDQAVSTGVRATVQAVESGIKSAETLGTSVAQAAGKVLQSAGQAVRALVESPASGGGGTGAKGTVDQVDAQAD